MKKTFNSPIYGMISGFEELAKDQGPEEAPGSEKPEEQKNPGQSRQERIIYKKPEAKNRRVQLLITPTLYEELKDEATDKGLSVNAYMNQILEDREKA